jgi:hypothetical protein
MESMPVMAWAGMFPATRAGAAPPAGTKSTPEPERPAAVPRPIPDVRLVVSMRKLGLKSLLLPTGKICRHPLTGH